jgi:hypothetical protein
MKTTIKIEIDQTKKSKHFREMLKSVGYFDGRFAPKKFSDKKKEENKKRCRTSIDN